MVTTPQDPTVDTVTADLAALADPKILAVNERHGDDHAVNLTKLRAVAKAVKANHPLAKELWATGESAPRLEVLKDYPTPPNCTSPFAPAWIAEMVSRQAAG